MTYLLSLDPGYKKSGIAVFDEDSLCYGALVQTSPVDDLAVHWQTQTYEIYRAVREALGLFCTYNVVVEIMQVDDRTGKAQAKQLLRLSGLAGAVSNFSAGSSHSYPPSEWNKNRSKGPNHAKILRALTDQEKDDLLVESEKITDGDGKPLFESLRPQIKEADQLYDRAVDEHTGQAEHVLDAVGIGLYHLGRLR